jgi:SRSO17 transposase
MKINLTNIVPEDSTDPSSSSDIKAINYDNDGKISEHAFGNEEMSDTKVDEYDKMTVKELKNILAQKGVSAKSSMNKSEIINVLKGTTNM